MTETQQLVAFGIETFIIFASVWTLILSAIFVSLFRGGRRG